MRELPCVVPRVKVDCGLEMFWRRYGDSVQFQSKAMIYPSEGDMCFGRIRLIGLIFCFQVVVLANVHLRCWNRGVWAQNPNRQRIGTIQFTLNYDEFPAVSREHPVYICVHLDRMFFSALATTVVVYDSPAVDHDPVNLALILDSQEDVMLSAPDDAVQIVRWVYTEPELWLRVNVPTHQWVLRGGHTEPPGPTTTVSFFIGHSPTESLELVSPYYETGKANLPANTALRGVIADTSLMVFTRPDGPNPNDPDLYEGGFGAIGYDFDTEGVTTALSYTEIREGSAVSFSLSGDDFLAIFLAQDRLRGWSRSKKSRSLPDDDSDDRADPIFIAEPNLRDLMTRRFDVLEENNQLTTAEAALALTATFNGVENVEGLQHFSSLMRLNCWVDEGQSPPPLDWYPRLQFLDIRGSGFDGLLDLACVPDLQILNVLNTALETFPSISQNQELVSVTTHGNGFSELPDMRNLKQLERLSCRYEQLEFLPDLTPNQSLYDVDVSSNQIAQLPTFPFSLVTLDCTDNNLTSLPEMGYLVNLENAYFGQNHLTALPDLSGNLQLLRLGCNHNQFQTIDVSALPPNLRSLVLSGNLFKDVPLDLANLLHLSLLNLEGNYLTNEDCPDLLYLSSVIGTVMYNPQADGIHLNCN